MRGFRLPNLFHIASQASNSLLLKLDLILGLDTCTLDFLNKK